MSPVPLYNSFADLQQVHSVLQTFA
jgi:hypothetical protein